MITCWGVFCLGMWSLRSVNAALLCQVVKLCPVFVHVGSRCSTASTPSVL